MTERPDTAKIRAEWPKMDSFDRTNAAWALMDALDAARADRNQWQEDHNREFDRAEAAEAELEDRDEADAILTGLVLEHKKAREAAEAERDADIADFEAFREYWTSRAVEAEARIAAALAELEPNNCVKLPKWWVAIMRAKLNGDTI